MAFFRVKLHAKNIPGVHARRKGTAVVRKSKNHFLLFRREIVRMQKVKPPRPSDILEQALPASRFDVVPSPVRQVRALGWRCELESLNLRLNPSQSFQRT